MDWTLAVCHTEEGKKVDFYPDGAHAIKEYAKAKVLCNRCPLEDECREHALTKPEPFGFWGGMNERERRIEIKRRQRLAKRTPLRVTTEKVVA